MNRVTNVVLAGLGGQGVLKASDILADAAFRAGFDVKKSEIHGMAQRGGSVSSDVRFGAEVLSPMVPIGEAHFLVVLNADQAAVSSYMLHPEGLLIEPSFLENCALANGKSMNVALLGFLSALLDIAEEHWTRAIQSVLAPELHEANLLAFAAGRQTALEAGVHLASDMEED